MRSVISAFLVGALFSVGLVVSQMVNPTKVINFLDVTSGRWDPSLLFVMVGALPITFFGYRFALKNSSPKLEQKFYLPTNTNIDVRLIFGAIVFGVGWGLSGLCPGPSISALLISDGVILWFLLPMLAGMISTRGFLKLYKDP